MLIDSFDRTIDYLRVSVTDRCNFRCVYCMPEEGAPVSPKDEILTFEEIARLVSIAAALGMSKIRLTGGEPLVRRDIDRLVDMVGAVPGLRDLSLTTNGFLLTRYVERFARAGLNRVNVSLDTLRHDRFARIARRGDLETVLAGIDAAVEAGLHPVKLNCVVMRGWNDDEAVDFARLTMQRPYDVRFIELMPIRWSAGEDSSGGMQSFYSLAAPAGYRSDSTIRVYANMEADSFRSLRGSSRADGGSGQLDATTMRRAFVPSSETRACIETVYGPMQPADVLSNGPARSFRIPGAKGTVGFISQITNDMCLGCNRLRLTADGQLRPCLMADGEADLRTPLRSGATDDELAEVFRLVVRHKPKEHRIEDGIAATNRNMSQLGG